MHTLQTLPLRFGRRGRCINTLALGILIALAASGAVSHAAQIKVGNHALAPNRAGQQITIPVTGGELVAGVDLFAQVGDGGPELVNVGLPPGTDGPAITSVDLKSGAIFAGTPAVQVDQDRSGVVQVFFSSIVLSDPPPAPQTVAANGNLVTLTLDTTGLSSGSFNLLLAGVLPGIDNGPFDTTLIGAGGAAVATTITNGKITIPGPGAGDYNGNGIVDAADYVVWRDTLGSISDLRADGDDSGGIEQADYDVWKITFGDIVPAVGVALPVAAPEPSSLSHLLVALAAVLRRHSRRR